MSRLQFTSQSCHFVQWYCQLWYIFGAFLFRIFFLKETKTFNLNTPDGKGELELWTFSELFPSKVTAGLPWWLSGKEFACQCQRCGFNPRVRKILWRRKWQPTPVFLPGKSHEQRSLVGHSPWDHKSRAWQQQNHHHHHCAKDAKMCKAYYVFWNGSNSFRERRILRGYLRCDLWMAATKFWNRLVSFLEALKSSGNSPLFLRARKIQWEAKW